MARYGTFLYGTTLYGAAGNLSSTGLLAQVVDYEKVVIRVVVPDRVGKDYVLIRSYNGSAEQPNEGLVISRGTIADSEFEYIDSPETTGAHLTPGWCYYTLFIIDDLSWVKDAATSVLVPEDRGTYQYLLENLPSIFTSEDFNPLEVVDYNGTLANFLKGFTLTFDEWAGHIDSLLPDRRNAEVVRRLDPTRAESVGLPDEYTIGTAASHRLHREAGKIYAQKGTIDGIATYVKALTGWETVAYEGFNLLLDLDDCSFEAGIGNWGVSGGTLTKATVNGTTVTSCDLYDAQTGPMYDFKREGVGLVTLTSASATITLPASNLLKTVPVPHEAVVGDSYTFVVPSRAATGTPDVTAKITWLDGAGATVGSVATGTPLTTGATWASATVTSTVPTGAKYARLSVVVDGADPEAVHLDMLYFGETQSTFYYWDARSVDIICNPVMVNQFMDPSIDDAGLTYFTTVSGTVTADAGEHLYGLRSLKLVNATVFHQRTTVKPNEYYTLRMAAKGAGTFKAQIKWYDSTHTLISTSDDLDFGTPGADWVTDYAVYLSPENAHAASVYFIGTGTTYVDTILLANASNISTFFSGSAGDSDGEDIDWFGTAGGSISTLYPNRPTKLSRLRDTIDYYLPLGVSWRILLWGDSPVIYNAVDFIPGMDDGYDELYYDVY